MVNARGSLERLNLFYSQVPNKRWIKINGRWEISENFNNGGWEFSENFNLTKQGSHHTTGRACCGVRFLAGNCSLRIYCFALACDSLSDLKNK